MSHNHQTTIERFVAACKADDRVVAAFLGGSRARGQADAYSDVDLCVITTDETFEGFVAQREHFVRLLGEPVFLEVFDRSNIAFFILGDGSEGELNFHSEGHLDRIHSGPFQTLVDKRGILAGAAFPEGDADPAEQIETLRRLIYWFWHELSHFITAMGRGQTWWAYGQLEALRRHCVSLARLRHNFTVDSGGDEPYFKVENAIPVEQLSSLQATICPQEPAAMLQAVLIIVSAYRELAQPLARAHGIAYPDGLERVLADRLEKLRIHE